MRKGIAFAAVLMVFAACGRPHPADPGATRETVKLYRNLLALQSGGMMFGHQDALLYGYGWFYEEGRSDVKEVCGDYPAVCGWELGHLELGDSLSLDSVRFDKIRSLLTEAFLRGNVNTISWHLRNPLTGGSAWDVTSAETVRSLLPGGEKHSLFMDYLDKLAGFLLSLRTPGGPFIPVVFRPYHEHTGSWFWWGRNLCTADDYMALWRLTVTYLRETRGIHHLLYAYSTDRFTTREEYLERYPGDDLIDIVAFDLYDRGPGFPETLGNCAAIVSQIAKEKKKIAAVSETGGPIARQTDWWTAVLLKTLEPFDLSWVLVWRNPHNNPAAAFAPFKGHPSTADFLLFHDHPETLFLKDIAPLKLYR